MGLTGFNRWRRYPAIKKASEKPGDRTPSSGAGAHEPPPPFPGGQAAPAPDTGVSLEDELLVAVYEAACAGEVTKSGKPEVLAVEKRLGRNISAADRDQAWEIVKPEFVE